MTFNINDMRSELVFGGARNTLFNFELVFPTGTDFAGASRKLTFMAKAASLPPTVSGVIPVGYFGRKINVDGDRTYPPWSIDVINDEDFKVRQAFELWFQKRNMIQANIAQYTFPAEYKVDGLVNQYNKRGTRIRSYKFSGMFPSRLGEIQTGWDMNDRIEEFQVEFAFDFHETIGITGVVAG